MAISDTVAGPLQSLGSSAASYAASYAWGPLLSLSRTTILSLLSRIQIGQLKIVDVDGRTTVYGERDVKHAQNPIYSAPRAELTVHKEMFWVRLLLFADMVGTSKIKKSSAFNRVLGSRRIVHAGRSLMSRPHIIF